MFDRLLEKQLNIEYLQRVLIKDYDNIIGKYYKNFKDKYKGILYEYVDVEKFRYIYETKIKSSNDKCIILVPKEIYLPYDILKNFDVIDLSYDMLFPKLNSFVFCKLLKIVIDKDWKFVYDYFSMVEISCW